jgi:hypothetical protein
MVLSPFFITPALFLIFNQTDRLLSSLGRFANLVNDGGAGRITICLTSDAAAKYEVVRSFCHQMSKFLNDAGSQTIDSGASPHNFILSLLENFSDPWGWFLVAWIMVVFVLNYIWCFVKRETLHFLFLTTIFCLTMLHNPLSGHLVFLVIALYFACSRVTKIRKSPNEMNRNISL